MSKGKRRANQRRREKRAIRALQLEIMTLQTGLGILTVSATGLLTTVDDLVSEESGLPEDSRRALAGMFEQSATATRLSLQEATRSGVNWLEVIPGPTQVEAVDGVHDLITTELTPHVVGPQAAFMLTAVRLHCSGDLPRVSIQQKLWFSHIEQLVLARQAMELDLGNPEPVRLYKESCARALRMATGLLSDSVREQLQLKQQETGV